MEGRSDLAQRFHQSFAEIAAIGRAAADGYKRWAWTPEDRAARAWFEHRAAAAGLDVEVDRNGNQWAWWGAPGTGAVATGSHLDTVASGGAFDGALGIVSSLVAVEELRLRGLELKRPVAVVNFWEEEGARFGIPTAGSGLMTGHVDPVTARGRRAHDGAALGDELEAFGIDPSGLGADPERTSGISCYVELHVEQGRNLVHEQAALGVGTGVWGHGRWRLDLHGEANHAGTTRMGDRRDPMAVLATAIVAARREAIAAGAVATIGRVEVEPNVANAIPDLVTVWLDARAEEDARVDDVVERWWTAVQSEAAADGVEAKLSEQSRSAPVAFDAGLRTTIQGVLEARGGRAVPLPSPAGHDAAEMSAVCPAAMLFVRNPTGVSHNPAEHAETQDCVTGVEALAAVLEELACR